MSPWRQVRRSIRQWNQRRFERGELMSVMRLGYLFTLQHSDLCDIHKYLSILELPSVKLSTKGRMDRVRLGVCMHGQISTKGPKVLRLHWSFRYCAMKSLSCASMNRRRHWLHQRTARTALNSTRRCVMVGLRSSGLSLINLTALNTWSMATGKQSSGTVKIKHGADVYLISIRHTTCLLV